MTVIELYKDEFKQELNEIAKGLKSGAVLNAIIVTEMKMEDDTLEPDIEVTFLNVVPGRLAKGMMKDAGEELARLTVPPPIDERPYQNR